MNPPRIVMLGSFLLLFSLSVQVFPVFAQPTQVSIEIVDNSITTRPAQLLTDTDYQLLVRVLDKDNKPVSGASVSLSVVGPGTIVGDRSSNTDNNGVGSLSVRFDSVGTLQVFVDGKRAGRILVNYNEVPGTVIAYPAILLILLTGAALYLGFRGPLSLYMGKSSK